MIDVGLQKQDLDTIISVISKYPEVEEAVIFGSRAKGNFKNGSDIDIALKGKNLDLQLISAISIYLNEETNLPYKLDVLNYHSIKNEDLTEHINRVGVSFFKRKM